MRILKLNALCGVKNQMYCADQYVNVDRPSCIYKGFLDINSLFWSKILAPTQVKELLALAKIRLTNDPSPKVQAVLQKPDKFFETFKESLKALDMPVTDQVLFQSLETLEIVCYLHSKLYSMPFVLTLAEGYVHSKFSALDLENLCLLPFCNPYLLFIESEIIPLVLDYHPDILVLTGKPNIASFAIAKIVRGQIPNILILAAEHESDYYSLQKIKKLLTSNTAFFSVYHCVVLYNTTNTIDRIQQSLSEGSAINLSSVPGIIYSLDDGNTVICTAGTLEQSFTDISPYIDKKRVLNIRAFPQNHCYWNRCTFCGINSKYGNMKNQTWDVEAFILKVKTLYADGIKKIWLLDEAIPAYVLRNLAEQLLLNDIHIIWHLRTRFELDFTEVNFAKLLWQAGLRHILFGFESASNRILQLTQKTTDISKYLEIAERIVQNITANKIAVHFSAILGFPTETKQEREETCSFLKYMVNSYEGFSYNVNTFYLDVGSKMYSRWESFDISSLSYPCAPKYFLDNHIDWNNAVSPDKFAIIQEEQEQLMAQQYPWFPKGTLISPSVFFSFWEYSRYCLEEHPFVIKPTISLEFMDQMVNLSPMVSFNQINATLWQLYHLQNHHYITGGKILWDLINADENGLTFNQIIKKYAQSSQQPVRNLILQLAQMDFFV